MSKTTSAKGFPFTVRRGSVSVKIYHTPNRGHDGYTVSYCNPKRKRKAFAMLADAKAEADRVATHLAAGQPDLTKISSADWACYVRAKQLAERVNFPLDLMAAQFVEAKQALGSASLTTAVEYYLKKHPRDLQQQLIKKVIAEMLETKRQDGLNLLYIRHLRYGLDKVAKAFGCSISTMTGGLRF